QRIGHKRLDGTMPSASLTRCTRSPSLVRTGRRSHPPVASATVQSRAGARDPRVRFAPAGVPLAQWPAQLASRDLAAPPGLAGGTALRRTSSPRRWTEIGRDVLRTSYVGLSLMLVTAVSMKGGRSSRVEPGGPWPVGGARLSIASWLEEQVARSSGWPSSDEGRQATRALVGGLAGANGWERVSMDQLASVSWRATSTRATLAPRWRPSRCLVR